MLIWPFFLLLLPSLHQNADAAASVGTKPGRHLPKEGRRLPKLKSTTSKNVVANMSSRAVPSSKGGDGIQQRAIRIRADDEIQRGNEDIVFDSPYVHDVNYGLPNDRMVFYQSEWESLVYEGVSLVGNDFNRQERIVGNSLAERYLANAMVELRVHTCLEPKIRPVNEFVPNNRGGSDYNGIYPFVNIRLKYSDFYHYKKWAARCASTYEYKTGEGGMTGDGQDMERPHGAIVKWAMIFEGRPGEQIPDTNCFQLGKILHEFFHGLGVIHEHQRPDRNNYVSLPSANMDNARQCSSATECYGPEYYDDEEDDKDDLHVHRSRFRIVPGMEVNTFAQPYDYGSAMHFGPLGMVQKNDGGRRRGTGGGGANLLNDMPDGQPDVLTINKLFANTIGQRARPSFQDLKRINLKFCLRRLCGDDYHGTCRNGGYLNPSHYAVHTPDETKEDPPRLKPIEGQKCTHCICPEGFDTIWNCEKLIKNSQWIQTRNGYFKKFTQCDGQVAFVVRSNGNWPENAVDGQMEVNSRSKQRGKIEYPPPLDMQDPDWNLWLWSVPPEREEISCYWRIKPEHPYEKVAVKLASVNLPCLFPCHSYVEIKYKRDKGLTGARFCCNSGSPTLQTAKPDQTRHFFNKTPSEEAGTSSFGRPNEFLEIVADNGVPIVVIFRLGKPSDLINFKAPKPAYKPGFLLHFWALNSGHEWLYSLSYQKRKYFLPRNGRHQLDPEDPHREGVGYGAGEGPYRFAEGGYLPHWRDYYYGTGGDGHHHPHPHH